MSAESAHKMMIDENVSDGPSWPKGLTIQRHSTMQEKKWFERAHNRRESDLLIHDFLQGVQ